MRFNDIKVNFKVSIDLTQCVEMTVSKMTVSIEII